MARAVFINFFILGVFSLCQTFDVYSQEWELAKEKEGIKIYTRTEPGNSIKSYRAVAIINQPAVKVFSIISDVNEFDWWGDDIKQVIVLKYEPGKMAQYYLEYSLPWPLDNRDLAVEVSFTEDPNGKSFSSTAVANPDLINEKKGRVRIRNYHQTWSISPDGENSCQVILEGFADPSGNVPDWITNIAITDSPFKAISGLRDKLKGN